MVFFQITVFGLAFACFPYSYVYFGVFELIIVKLGSSLQIFCCDIMSICEFFLSLFFFLTLFWVSFWSKNVAAVFNLHFCNLKDVIGR